MKPKPDPHIWLAIGWLIFVFMIAVIFSSCKPSLETCNRLYPPQIKEITKDSISYEKEMVFIPGDTTYISFPFNCVEDSLKGVIDVFKGKLGQYDMALNYVKGQLSLWVKRYNDSVPTFNKYAQKTEVKIEKVPYQVDKPYIPKVFWILFIIASVIVTIWLVRLFK